MSRGSVAELSIVLYENDNPIDKTVEPYALVSKIDSEGISSVPEVSMVLL